MRTFAQRQIDLAERRYQSFGEGADPKTDEGAMLIIGSRGGKAAAKVAVAELWKASQEWTEGWLPTAKISAPLRVLEAMETLRLIERADDDRGRAIRFRLTTTGRRLAAKK
jgi:hypothetical protein